MKDEGARTGTVDDSLPLTVLVPETLAEPVTIFDHHAALRIAVVERIGVQALEEDWGVPGVYILLDPVTSDGTWGCYVGKAPAGLRSRLQSHLRAKDHWHKVVLVCRDTTHGFNSAQIGWLEGRLHDLLGTAEDARLHNGVRPTDESLPPWECATLESCVMPISRVLRLLGHDPSTLDDSAALPPKRSSRFFGVTVADLISGGVVTAETQLVSTNSVWPAKALLLADGRVQYEQDIFASPSAAASAVRNGAANGWTFWAVETECGKVPLSVLRARYTDDQLSASGKGAEGKK